MFVWDCSDHFTQKTPAHVAHRTLYRERFSPVPVASISSSRIWFYRTLNNYGIIVGLSCVVVQ